MTLVIKLKLQGHNPHLSPQIKLGKMSLKYSLAAPQQEIKLNQIPLSQLLPESGEGFMHNIKSINRG